MTDIAQQMAILRSASRLSLMTPELVRQLELCYDFLTGDDLRSLFILATSHGFAYKGNKIDEVHVKQLIDAAKFHLERLNK